MSLSIPSWQISTAHVQPFRGARDLVFCLKVPLDSPLVWASSKGSGETARMRRLAWTFAARIGDKYQIRLKRLKWFNTWLSFSLGHTDIRTSNPIAIPKPKSDDIIAETHKKDIADYLGMHQVCWCFSMTFDFTDVFCTTAYHSSRITRKCVFVHFRPGMTQTGLLSYSD